MLTHLDIRNFTIIPTLSLSFSPGMTVLTGETGAGKSIILNALTLALGARTKKNVVRDTSSPAEISLSFHLTPNGLAQKWLKDNELDEGPECIIRRVIYADGRTRSTINGRSCSLSMTRDLAEYLIHIHSQHQQQQLLKSAWQRECVDHFGQHRAPLKKLKDLHHAWSSLETEIQNSKKSKNDHSHELALIQYQLEELTELSPEPNEWETLSQRHDTLAQSEQIRESLATCLLHCRDGDNQTIQNLLQDTLEQLNQLPLPLAKNTIELLKNAAILCEEASDELASLMQSVDPVDNELHSINARLTRLSDIARKHQIHPSELTNKWQELSEKQARLSNLNEHVQQLQAEQAVIFQSYLKAAETLTKKRKAATKKLASHITQAINKLNMPGSTFEIILHSREKKPHPLGLESIEFRLSTQPNSPPQALGDIASGGELSRITLTLMLATADATHMPIFLFDEIDVGMGGQTAKLVGQLICDLSSESQVFCITHLPQVAALGHHHYRVNKALSDDVVTSAIQPLTKQERVMELARMTNGDTLTEEALAHANSLVCNQGEEQA